MGARDFISKEVYISLSEDRRGFNCREQLGKLVSRQQFVSACALGERVPLPDSPVQRSTDPRPRFKDRR
jgi:hypothetical protein